MEDQTKPGPGEELAPNRAKAVSRLRVAARRRGVVATAAAAGVIGACLVTGEVVPDVEASVKDAQSPVSRISRIRDRVSAFEARHGAERLEALGLPVAEDVRGWQQWHNWQDWGNRW